MNNLLKFLLLSTLLFATACSQLEASQDNTNSAESPIAENLIDNNDSGLIKVSSSYSVADTSDRLEKIIAEKGLTLFTRIDHGVNAQKAELELKPTQLLIFGNPKVGTPLMNCSATTAIDLPQKLLVMQDENKQTQIIYNSPQYLRQRHNIEGCDEVLNKVSGVLKGIAEEATK